MEENVSMDICRACLTEEGEFQSIFIKDESTGLNIHLAEMIMAYASVQITVGDGFPEKICVPCAKQASQLYLFKKKCEDTDTALRQRFGRSPFSSAKLYTIEQETFPNLDFDLGQHEAIIIKPEISEENSGDIIDAAIANESDDEPIEEEIKPTSWQTVNIAVEEPKEVIVDNSSPAITQIFECDLCNKAFSRKDLLIQHKKFHHEVKLHVRPEDQFMMITEELVETLTVKTGQKPEEEELENDNAEEKSETLEEKCDIIVHLQSESNVDKSKKSDDKNDKKSLECEECHKKFTKGSHLTRHMKIHAKIKPHICQLCNKGFARSEQLNNHMNMHSGVKPHVCKICSKGFNQISNLKDHMRTHNGEKPFLCATCGKGFNQLGNLRQHTIRHSGIKAHLCSICGNGFASKGELCAHLRKHTGARPFVCQICNHGFTTSSSLTKHKRIHSGEKPYECDVCKMKFSRSGILARHRRTHTGEKPYVCKYCTKAFSQSNDLSSHLRIHTGEKPFICDVCGQAFRQSSALKTHKKTHMDRNTVLDSKVVIGMVHGTLFNTLNSAVLKPEFSSENVKVNFM